MFQYHCLNPIAEKGLKLFGDNYKKTETADQCDAILVRSAKMHDMELPKSVCAVARAGAGVNNIPVKEYAEKGVVVFNTPGANANGVKELVLAGMLLASRDIVGGIEWVAQEKDKEHIGKLAEKQKKQFAGCEISGKKLGIIGLGAIGAMVANAACGLGMEVYGYDPYLSIDAAWNLSRTIKHSKSLDEIYSQCDYITIHVPLLDSTKKMINKEAFDKMKDGVVLLNFARDLLVDEDALIEAVESGKVKKYVTDFANETVAEEYFWREIPFLYRTHDVPDEEKIRKLGTFINNFGYNLHVRNEVRPKEIQKLLCKVEGTPEEPLISRLALRSMKQAKYTTENTGHFGLAAKYYTHFTSPIRRYPDLQIHRIIKENLRGRLTGERMEHYRKILTEVASQCSQRERTAEESEREVVKLKKAEYMQAHIGGEYEGVISGVTKWGVYVELPNTIEGLIHVADMRDDHYNFIEETYEMVGEHTGKTWKLGQKVQIRVTDADRLQRTVNFEFV